MQNKGKSQIIHVFIISLEVQSKVNYESQRNSQDFFFNPNSLVEIKEWGNAQQHSYQNFLRIEPLIVGGEVGIEKKVVRFFGCPAVFLR